MFNRLVQAAVLAAFGVTLFYWWRPEQPIDHPSSETFDTLVAPIELPKYAQIKPFTLQSSENQPFHSAQELEGNVWLATFFFTRCEGPCPMIHARLAEIYKDLIDLKSLRMVSITVDPTRDTPEVLSAYGKRWNADPLRWFFLTGTYENIRDIALSHFRLPMDEDPNLHSTRIVLVDTQGRIRGYYDGLDADSLARMKVDTRGLALEAIAQSSKITEDGAG